MSNCVWNFSGGGIRDFDLNLVWYLSFDSVRNFFRNLNWLKGFNLVLFGNVVSLGNLVWDLFNGHNWDFLSNLIFFSHILCDCVSVSIIRRVGSRVFSVVTNLGPAVLVSKTTTSKSTVQESITE